MLKALISIYQSAGFVGILTSLRNRIVPIRSMNCSLIEALLSGKIGLEIGGPSRVFKKNGALPIYPIAMGLDNVNFSDETIWEGAICKGKTFSYSFDKALGTQYISEASELQIIKSSSYDFVISSHMLEHTANPLRALSEWMRVIKVGGHLVLILPQRERTFDHKRPITTFAHLIEDYKNQTKEDDLTHLSEILRLHDLKRDRPAGTPEEFARRSANNYKNRCLHHHVFDTSLVTSMLNYLSLEIRTIEIVKPHHIIAIAQKVPVGEQLDKCKGAGTR